ncbi:Hypothetical predicted protein [Marmota monax]|uniref:Uncharacterized protein n=1 Tax=Marmota monax TaxID=9995 RepID=A0A5E4B8J6_MARMO|nr:hypothetical protein GHT09_012842 [Marmota monax]VTJ66028.1 Hypothetical predicted protein [Marmota monax]
MVSLFTGTHGSGESWGGSLSTGEQGPAFLQPTVVRRKQKCALLKKKNLSSAQVLQKQPHFPRRRTSSCGGIPGREEQGPFLLAALGHTAGAGTCPGWEMGWELAWRGL